MRIEKPCEELYTGEFRDGIRGSKHDIRVEVFKGIIKASGWIEFWHLLTNLPDLVYPKQAPLTSIMRGRA